ncbi:MAG: (Fe-S)-binding protein [Polyangiaceae bacterium]
MRPDERPMRRLPTLEARRDTLEKCVFCPKLCRTTCPVSNEAPRETLTPWGKMSMAYFSAHGDVEATESFAEPAWACTGCHACRSACDHGNDVAGTLLDARSALKTSGLIPAAAARAIEAFAAHETASQSASTKLARDTDARADSKTHVVVGCGYVTHAEESAKDIVVAASRLTREPVAIAPGCCGLPLLYAGDQAGFVAHAERFAGSLRDAERVIVADAGCAMALRKHYPAAGVTVKPKIELLVDVAARELARLTTLGSNETIRYHDPCQLSRGLGVTEAPRAILTRILGRAPAEFETSREQGSCAGSGGLLPITMPAISKGISRSKTEEHERLGGGHIVTACASSLRAFRKSGAHADDIATWIARALPDEP